MAQWDISAQHVTALEMVTDEERDYMRQYASPRMKANVGIRRRLARRCSTTTTSQIELFTALLLSLPGSPGPLLRRRDRDGRRDLVG